MTIVAVDPVLIHREAIVIDSTCPLASDPDYVSWYRDGGATVVCPTIATVQSAPETFRALAGWRRRIADDPSLRAVRRGDDVLRAKSEQRTGIVFHFQGTAPIEGDLDLVDMYADLGVRVMGLCYNTRNRVGDGAEEPTDAGLSRFGHAVIKRLNETRVLVDCSHTGYRTSMEAISASAAPIVLSHSNPFALHPSPRNVADDLIRAVAGSGGVIGIAGFPAFLVEDGQPTLDRYIDAITYVAELVGVDAVGIGVDFYSGQHGVVDEIAARRFYDAAIANGRWSIDSYPPPPHRYPRGLETPRELPNLTAALVRRGFGEADVRKVLGENWLRVWGEVWG